MKKLHEVSQLIDVYGKLITEKQYNCLTLFYFDDLSLAEIAQIKKTTRAAVYNNIEKASKKLLHFEKELNIVEKQKKRLEIYHEIKDDNLRNKLIQLEGN